MKLLEHFHKLSIYPSNAKELKGLVLQLAIQGKLTADWRLVNPDVEPAAVLLERIRAEKQELIKAKKIKKEKALPAIEVDEIPFELPDSWEWCRLIQVCEYIQRGKSPKYTEDPIIPVISQKCVQWSGFDISKARFITEESLVKYAEERFLQLGDLLWNSTGNGTIGRVILFPKTNYLRVVADSHVTVVRSFKNYVTSNYLWIFAASPLIQGLLEGRVSGSTKQTELGTGTVKSFEFAFPPIQEQKAIVKIVDTLLQEVTQLEQFSQQRLQLKEKYVTAALNQVCEENTAKAWADLKGQFSTFFNEEGNIKKLRETILQLAVQGKLTANWRLANPDVEPAAVLLERIKAEKQELIKAKQIKKEKALPAIESDEVPYALPDGWVWCRMGSISDVQRGSSPRPKGDPRYFSNIETSNHWISIKDISRFAKNHILLDTEEYLTDLGTNYSRHVYKDELIVAVSGSTTGKCCLIGIDGYIYDGLAVLRLINNSIDSNYLLSYMLQLYSHMNNSKFGAAFPNINTKFLNEMLFPFPSLQEQKAIVEKVNQLMDFCDTLEEEVIKSKETMGELMQAVLKEVFEGKVVEQVCK